MRFFYFLLIGVVGLSLFTSQAKQSILSNVTSSTSPLHTYKGEVFAAVPIPANIKAKIFTVQKKIQACLGKGQFSPVSLHNVHSTLQLIDRVSAVSKIKKIHHALKQAANKNKRWNLAKHLKHTKIAVHNDGIVVLKLPRSDALTKLALTIRKALRDNKIKYNKRFDFPNNAHITIGKVSISQVKRVRSLLQRCLKQSVLSSILNAKQFPLNYFLLLKSNNPAKVRNYAQLGAYNL